MRSILAPAPAHPVEPGPIPTFSVILAVYHAAETVGEAVESALRQSAPPHEVLVCDDGSTDGTQAALAPYRERITLLRKDHGGAASARNAAARAATADFLAILDADDVYLPDRLAALGELAAARPDLDILASDAFFEVEGRTAGRFNSDRHPFAVADQRGAILERNFILGNAAVRRERLVAIGGFDESLECAEDWDCWIRLILGGSLAGSVVEPLARYRIRRQSLTSDRRIALRCRVRALEKVERRSDLSPEEGRTLERSLLAHRQRAALAEAEAAILEREPYARRRAMAIAVGGGHGFGTRLKAALAAAAPRLAARMLERRKARSDRLTRVPEGVP